MTSRTRQPAACSGIVEVVWVWLTFALFLLVVFVTYSRSYREVRKLKAVQRWRMLLGWRETTWVLVRHSAHGTSH